MKGKIAVKVLLYCAFCAAVVAGAFGLRKYPQVKDGIAWGKKVQIVFDALETDMLHRERFANADTDGFKEFKEFIYDPYFKQLPQPKKDDLSKKKLLGFTNTQGLVWAMFEGAEAPDDHDYAQLCEWGQAQKWFHDEKMRRMWA